MPAPRITRAGSRARLRLLANMWKLPQGLGDREGRLGKGSQCSDYGGLQYLILRFHQDVHRCAVLQLADQLGQKFQVVPQLPDRCKGSTMIAGGLGSIEDGFGS